MTAFLRNPGKLGDLARTLPEPRDPVVQAIAMLGDVRDDPRTCDDAMNLVRALDLSRCDPDLHLLLLEIWAEAANNHGRYDEVQALTRRARTLVTPRTPPEIRALQLQMEAYLINVGGNVARRETILREMLAVIPRDSPRRPITRIGYAWSFAPQGLLAGIPAVIAEIGADPEYADLLRWITMVNAVETGQAAAARDIIAGMPLPVDPVWASGRLARHRGEFRWLRAAIAMMEGDASLARAYREIGFDDPRMDDYAGPEPQPDKIPPFIRVWHHLLERRPEEALALARESAAEGGEAYFRQPGITHLNLVRAELASGHLEAARHAIGKRREIGNIHYLDDLFLARIELLDGNRAAAARHITAVTAACDRYRARGRLDFEVRMACELSPGDSAWLARVMTGTPSGVPAAAAVPEPPSAPARGADRLIGPSRALADIRATIRRYAPLDAPVLITGETGTGKELAARAIHEESPRAKGSFLAVNCGAITESLLESELFGHERGAFTGAERAHRGIFEEAGAGTVLLDEIGDIPARLQVALLRVLETNEIRPVGSAAIRGISCRIVAATNANLGALAAGNRFRQDLRYRLQRLEIYLPPLRERPDDILPLALHLLREGRRDGRQPEISPEVRGWILGQAWSGNVRELKNFVERMRLLNSEALRYGPAELTAIRAAAPPAIAPAPATGEPEPRAGIPADRAAEEHFLRAGKSQFRRHERLRGLFRNHGSLTRLELAVLLGVSPFTVGRDLKRLLAEGVIEKVTPTASPRTHYFKLKSQERDL
ncbi:MAG: sigma 54-interacting transcriptional regulator [Planctomycetota bacterium]